MKNRIRKIIAAGFVIAASFGVTSCGTRTHEEIKEINGQKFLCTWTQEPSDPWTKKDYRCEAFFGAQP